MPDIAVNIDALSRLGDEGFQPHWRAMIIARGNHQKATLADGQKGLRAQRMPL